MQNEEICKEVIETLLHIKVGKLEYKSFEKDSKLEPDKRGIRLDVYIPTATEFLTRKFRIHLMFSCETFHSFTLLTNRGDKRKPCKGLKNVIKCRTSRKNPDSKYGNRGFIIIKNELVINGRNGDFP